MSKAIAKRARIADEPEPAWDVAYLFPPQGQWSEDEYFALNTNRLVELSDGCLEVLPMPTVSHQLITAYLYMLLAAYVANHDLGLVLFAGTRVRLRSGKIREPDVVFFRKEHAEQMTEEYAKGADLVMEVVSKNKKDRRRDLKIKRGEYALAKIPEYWIIDPEKHCITVLRLSGKQYVVHGEFTKQGTAASHLLPGFTVDVAEALGKGRLPTKPARKVKRKDAIGKPN